MNDIYDVVLSKSATKDLLKLPRYIVIKLESWIDDVGNLGLRVVRQIPGYHDEPLKGSRIGQRSIRLNKSYRAIYQIDANKIIEFVKIIGVNNHEY